MSAAARISLIYFLIAVIWIIASDRVLSIHLQGDPEMIIQAQTIKGWTFVGFTALVLYGLLRRELGAKQRSEEAAIRREAHFRMLFANNPLPMFVYDRETLRFLDINNAACSYYGYSREKFLKLDVARIRPPEDIPKLRESIANFSGMYKEAGQWIHLSKDGIRLEVEVYMLAFDYLGKPAILSVMRDVSEQKRNEAERVEHEKLRARLAQEDEIHAVRTRFMSMVSHEFRRPLTTITTSVDLLEHYRDRMTAEVAQNHFVRINEQLREMQHLLDDFLTLMQTEAAQQFNPAQTDLTELCTKLVEEVRLSSTATHTIRYTTDCEKLILSGDEKLLRHAIGNLLSNAVKYSPKGGEVVLDLRQRDGIEIRVSDQGIGIPEKDQEKLFDPFFRASNVGEMAGTGLGLPIAKQAVELHGGRLEIARSDGNGTEFLIWLPVDERTILTGC